MVFRSLLVPSRYPTARYGEDPLFGMQRAMQRTLDDMWGGVPSFAAEAAALSIRLDVKEDAHAYHVTADLPGLREDQVEVTFKDGLLTLRGEKKVERDEKQDTWHIVERSQGSFARQLSLPVAIDADMVEARFENGVLMITLPKTTHEEPAVKKIAIKKA